MAAKSPIKFDYWRVSEKWGGIPKIALVSYFYYFLMSTGWKIWKN